jgi:hypothetical protein
MSKVITFHFRSTQPTLYRIVKGKSSPGSKKKCHFYAGSIAQPASKKILKRILYLKILLRDLSNYEKTDLPKGTKAQDLCLCPFEVKNLNQRRK